MTSSLNYGSGKMKNVKSKKKFFLTSVFVILLVFAATATTASSNLAVWRHSKGGA